MGHPCKFQRVLRLGFVTAATSLNGSQPNFARCLAVYCILYTSLGWYTIYLILGLLPGNGILPGAVFRLHPSLALSYIGSVTARHSSSGRQQDFVALSRGHHLYYTGRPSRWALAHILVLSIFCSSNLSHCRLDVCHTSAHGAALVRIWDAGLKRAACGYY